MNHFIEFEDQCTQLHLIASRVEALVGVGALSKNIRSSADRLSELIHLANRMPMN